MRGVLWVVVLVGCVDTQTIECDHGVVCPAGTLCDVAHPGGCITQEQLDACEQAVANGATCTLEFPDDGVCDLGVCLSARCGDGLLSPGEQCDGAMFASTADDNCIDLGFYDDKALACSSSCMPVPMDCTGTCGDLAIDPRYEECDGTAPVGRECIDYGFGAGVLGCSINCGPGFDTCLQFGWEEIVMPATLTGLSGTSPTNVWVAGKAGFVRRYDGTSWLPVDISACTTADLKGVFALSPTDAFVYDIVDVIAISASGCTKTTSPAEIFGFWASSLTDVYVGGESSLQHFSNGTWTETAAADSPIVWGSGPDDVYAGNNNGELRHWNGTTWSAPAQIPGLQQLTSLWGTGPNDIYAAGGDASNQGVIVHNTGNGFTTSILEQEPVLAGDESILTGGSSAGGVTVASVPLRIGLTGINYLLRNAGAGWVTLVVPTTVTLSQFVASDGTIFALGGSADRVLKFTGTALLPTRGAPLAITDLAVRSASEAYLLASVDALYAWDGATWNQELTGIRDMVVTGSDAVLAIGTGGIQLRTGTNSWTQVAALNGSLMGASSDTDIWVSTAATQLTHWTGTLQSPVTLPMTVRDIAVVSPTLAFAVGSSGKIAHWNGTSWTAVASPAATTTILRGVWVRTPTDAYAWAATDLLLHYDGTSWSTFAVQPSPTSIEDVWSTGPNDLFVAGNKGLQHFDGVRWTPVQANALSLSAMDGDGEDLFVSSVDDVAHLLRTRPW
jgi:hypothetical protein